ncbi:MAG: hypothetical protein H0X45_02260 [Planctomycetes bacterium]|nr:hypothetical protein [Chloroflexota bacterium]MBA3845448.1 hypothetical protein [Planctomycetota bacterium]
MEAAADPDRDVRHRQGVHRYHSVVEGCAMAAKFRRSGLTVAEFSRQNGVTRKMILYWTGRERELAASHRPQELVRIPEPSPSATPTPSVAVAEHVRSPAASDQSIEVRLPSGAVLVVRAGFDASLLRELMRTLGAAC